MNFEEEYEDLVEEFNTCERDLNCTEEENRYLEEENSSLKELLDDMLHNVRFDEADDSLVKRALNLLGENPNWGDTNDEV